MSKQPKRGFLDYVKNPNLFREEARENEKADAPAVPKRKELAALIGAIPVRRLEYEELQIVKAAGGRAVPFLLDLFGDEQALLRRYGKSVLDGSPLEATLELLEPFALPEAKMLESALLHRNKDLRSKALYYLARCANDDAIDALKIGLASDSENCRTSTLIGLEFLAESRRGSKQFREALFEAALPSLNDESFGPAQHAPRALLVLNRKRATRVLLGEEVFSKNNRSVDDVLKALKDANVAVPGAQIRALLKSLKDKATRYPVTSAYATGLILLARAERSRAMDLIADARDSKDEWVRQGAAEAAQIAAGVKQPYKLVCDRYAKDGKECLTEPQLAYLTLSWLDADVNNGGFTQYFFNSSGELAQHAVRAATTVGAPQLAGIIGEAVALFDVDGPSPDRDQRMDQLSGIDLEALDKLSEAYYKCPEKLGEILPLFVSRNPKAFKA
jgi:hypothetical protein